MCSDSIRHIVCRFIKYKPWPERIAVAWGCLHLIVLWLLIRTWATIQEALTRDTLALHAAYRSLPRAACRVEEERSSSR